MKAREFYEMITAEYPIIALCIIALAFLLIASAAIISYKIGFDHGTKPRYIRDFFAELPDNTPVIICKSGVTEEGKLLFTVKPMNEGGYPLNLHSVYGYREGNDGKDFIDGPFLVVRTGATLRLLPWSNPRRTKPY